MRRIGSIIALAIFVGVAALVTLLVLAYGVETRLPSDVMIPGLDSEASIHWTDEYATISAETEADLFSALGFVHGVERTWSAALWRQTAVAGLASWFGAGLAEVDSLALQLGLAHSARESFRNLPSEDQALLRAYSSGMNRALERRSVRLQDEFAVLGVVPDPWEPWHALAVERLYAFLATSDVVDTLRLGAPAGLDQFVNRSERLRAFLAAGNHHHSAAWVAPLDGIRTLHARFVYGAAAEPYLHEQVLVLDGDTTVVASLPGSLVFPVGSSSGHAWAVLPTSTLRLEQSLSDTLRLPIVHDRIVDREGNEYLVTFRRSSQGLEIGEGFVRTQQDTAGAFIDRRVTYRIAWSGFALQSDIPIWRRLLNNDRGAFTLMDGTGIILSATGADVFGQNNSVVATSGDVSAVGPADWVDPIAQAVARRALLEDEESEIQPVFDDTYSVWAESIAPAMISGARSIPEPPRPVRDALTYLRNWDFRYDDASIAATVFDVWIGRYMQQSPTSPEVAAADTLFAERFLRYTTLVETVDELTERYGESMSQWRWENVMLDVRYAAGWPPASRFDDAPRNRRFPTIELSGMGHPSSPAYGPSPLDGYGRGSAVWEGLASPGPRLEARRRLVNMRSFLGRYMVTDRPPSFVNIRGDDNGRVTRLHP